MAYRAEYPTTIPNDRTHGLSNYKQEANEYLPKFPTEIAQEKSTKNAPNPSSKFDGQADTERVPDPESQDADICTCKTQSGFPRAEAHLHHGEYDHLLSCLVLTTVLHHRFGSRFGSILNCWQIAGPGCQSIRTINLDIVRCYTPNLSELDRLSAGSPAGPSIVSYKACVFGVCQSYLTKITFSTTHIVMLHAWQLAISINLESVIYLLYILWLPIRVVNNSFDDAKINTML
jgi:hypothetical protein